MVTTLCYLFNTFFYYFFLKIPNFGTPNFRMWMRKIRAIYVYQNLKNFEVSWGVKKVIWSRTLNSMVLQTFGRYEAVDMPFYVGLVSLFVMCVSFRKPIPNIALWKWHKMWFPLSADWIVALEKKFVYKSYGIFYSKTTITTTCDSHNKVEITTSYDGYHGNNLKASPLPTRLTK